MEIISDTSFSEEEEELEILSLLALRRKRRRRRKRRMWVVNFFQQESSGRIPQSPPGNEAVWPGISCEISQNVKAEI